MVTYPISQSGLRDDTAAAGRNPDVIMGAGGSFDRDGTVLFRWRCDRTDANQWSQVCGLDRGIEFWQVCVRDAKQ